MGLMSSWINLIYKAATSAKHVRNVLTPLGVLIFGVFTFIFILISVETDKFLNIAPILSYPYNLYLSAPLIILGSFLTFWSAFCFLKVNGTPVPINPPPEIVKAGPYGYTRNPMITGLYLFLFGLGIMIESFSLGVIFTPLYILFNSLELKYIEEPELEKRLGVEYLQYKETTPMYIPKLWALFKSIVK